MILRQQLLAKEQQQDGLFTEETGFYRIALSATHL
jgi:hypothetical protein